MRIAIVDDEEDMIADVKENIMRYCGEKKISVNFNMFTDGAEILKNYKQQYDVIFLDIEMNQISGMEAAYAIRKIDMETVIVFITHMAQYAIEGYRVDALDFLLKPVTPYQFDMVFRKVLRQLRMTSDRKISLQIKGDRKIIQIKKILYIEVQGHYLTWHMSSGEKIEEKGSLNEVEEQLADYKFIKCNRYCIVNPIAVSALEKETLILRNGDKIVLSRGKRKNVLLAIAEHTGGVL